MYKLEGIIIVFANVRIVAIKSDTYYCLYKLNALIIFKPVHLIKQLIVRLENQKTFSISFFE